MTDDARMLTHRNLTPLGGTFERCSASQWLSFLNRKSALACSLHPISHWDADSFPAEKLSESRGSSHQRLPSRTIKFRMLHGAAAPPAALEALSTDRALLRVGRELTNR